MSNIIPCLAICILISLSACNGHNTNETKQTAQLPEINCVAVLPVSVPVIATGTITEANKKSLYDGAAVLNSQLLEKLDVRPEFKVLTENQLDAILGNPWGGRMHQMSELGAATGCGAILETSVSRYRQRVGGDMSAEVPASAAFSMELYGVKRGTVIWTTSYKETQKALFDDIYGFSKAEKRGFKWLSVQELISGALEERLAEFPYFQENDI